MKSKTVPLYPVMAAFALLSGTALVAQPTPPSTAASPGAGVDPVQLEAFTVTGTNIRGVDTEKNLPITVITAEDLANSGFSTMTEVIEALSLSTNESDSEPRVRTKLATMGFGVTD